MTAAEFYAQVLAPAAAMQPIQILRSEASDVFLMAVAGHESNYTVFRQFPVGPGRGPWMFGAPTTALVLSNAATRKMAAQVCSAHNVAADGLTVYNLLPTDLSLAYAFARLLLWADPEPLPAPGDDDDAWQVYLNVWRPGVERPETWASIYATALEVVTEAYKAAPTA